MNKTPILDSEDFEDDSQEVFDDIPAVEEYLSDIYEKQH